MQNSGSCVCFFVLACKRPRAGAVSWPGDGGLNEVLIWRRMKSLLATLLLLFSTRAETCHRFHYWACPFPQHCPSAGPEAQAVPVPAAVRRGERQNLLAGHGASPNARRALASPAACQACQHDFLWMTPESSPQ